jgi:hypothetical protein
MAIFHFMALSVLQQCVLGPLEIIICIPIQGLSSLATWPLTHLSTHLLLSSRERRKDSSASLARAFVLHARALYAHHSPNAALF